MQMPGYSDYRHGNFIGLISGTSMDGVDAALVKYADADRFTCLAYLTLPYPREIRQALLALTANSSIAAVAKLDQIVGELFADAALQLLARNQTPAETIIAIGSHGQTVLHQTEKIPHYTWQIGDANIIAERTRIMTVTDFRRADLAAGGEGAPLTPALHAALLQHSRKHRAVVNIGGMANVTVLAPKTETSSVSGFDTGPGNVLLDAWIERQRGLAFDAEGSWSRLGTCQTSLLASWLTHPYFQKKPPKSTGRDDFSLSWLDRHLPSRIDPGNAVNIQATLVELTATTIATAIKNNAPKTEELLICGGGGRNLHLMERLRSLLMPISITTTEQYGLPIDAVEAICFAWLARQRLLKATGNLPLVTGARTSAVLGGIYAPAPEKRQYLPR